MQPAKLEFQLSSQLDVENLTSYLRECFTLIDAGEREVEIVYYDTFDWRLHRAGLRLSFQQTEYGHQLQLKSGSESRPVVQAVEFVPRFAQDIPAGHMQRTIALILKMRALLVQARVRVTSRRLHVLNEDQKTTVRLLMRSGRVIGADGTTVAELAGRLLLQEVRGYADELSTVRTRLVEETDLRPVTHDLLEAALHAQGRAAAGYTGKLQISIEPETRADTALRGILLHLLEMMELNEVGLIEDVDSEFLHDFRVAVRRTRSALSQIRRVLPSESVDYFGGEFGWLGKMTGPTRDLDVYLLHIDDYRADLPQFARNDLEPLHKYLTHRQKAEHARLVVALRSARYAGLKSDWRDALGATYSPGDEGEDAARPIVAVASQRISKTYRRVLKEGRAIDVASPANALHDLRKRCKKLRYLLEFFQSIYAPGKVKRLIKELKLLQDNLGAFQDYEVQIDALRSFAEGMAAEGDVSVDTLMAMGILIGNLHERQKDAREQFAASFAHFDSKKNRARFKELFP